MLQRQRATVGQMQAAHRQQFLAARQLCLAGIAGIGQAQFPLQQAIGVLVAARTDLHRNVGNLQRHLFQVRG